MDNHIRFFFVLLLAGYLLGCTSVPEYEPVSDKEPSYALSKEGTQLVDRFFNEQPNPDLSGFFPLVDGLDAFAARIALIEAAQTSVDIQYYLYHRQESGALLSAYLLKAAQRGVRVRILLDDMSQAESEEDLAALALHDNIEVRLFNPLSYRNLRFLSFISDYPRVSRRMHNKTFVVDSQVFITGGRNIGNAYFSGEDHAQFVDLDVLGIGPIVDKAAHAFDLYWNHPLAERIEGLYGKGDTQHYQTLQQNLLRLTEDDYGADSPYVQRLKESDIVMQLRRGKLDLEWTTGYLYVDDPNKLITDSNDTTTHMAPQMLAAMGTPQSKAIIISPYFIPRDSGVALIKQWRDNGVEVTILTNSLSATDVAVVHAGYANYREQLLELGVNLWELKRNFDDTDEKIKIKSFGGSSTASLHAKTMAFDDDQIFIGSLNLDPRSFNLNTEQGVVLKSLRFTQMLQQWVEDDMPDFAWRVTLDEDGKLQWQDNNGVLLHEEPDTTAWLRFTVWMMSLLPIEKAL